MRAGAMGCVPVLVVLAGACGSTSEDEPRDAGMDVVQPSSDAPVEGGPSDSPASDEGLGSDSDSDAESDPFGVCHDVAAFPIPKKWRVSCCGGSVCQGTCEQGVCNCGNVVGGCGTGLVCCNITPEQEFETLVCAGTGVGPCGAQQ